MSTLFKDYPDVIDVKQLSKMLHINVKAAYQLLINKKIDSFKIGRIYRIPKTCVIKFINENHKYHLTN